LARAARGVSDGLRLVGVVAGYEPGLDIVKGVDLDVRAGELLALLGPNGAGKSTLLKAAAGLVPVRAGTVTLGGADLTALPIHARSRRGLAFVPQTENVFASLTVRENLQIGAAALPRADRSSRIAALLAQFSDLAAALHKPAGRLSGGQRQMLALARALLVAPRALLADEPSAGLAAPVVAQVMAELRRIAQSGVAVLLVEQNVDAALRCADRAVVLIDGTVARAAPAAELATDPQLGALFLGHARAAA
jgi:branched-chain amino acid transport system ATP-binding protein